MDDSATVVARAKERAIKLKLPYAGALLPGEAHALMRLIPEAKLVDVRTRAEWDWVGRIPGALTIEWNSWPGGQPNPQFIAQLLAEVTQTHAPLMFICRSGGR
jgi:rhodanese-related sulfurtransferase